MRAYPPAGLTLLCLLLPACAHVDPRPPESVAATASAAAAAGTAENAPPRTFTILAINDVYRIEGVDGGDYGGLARLRSLRAELERETPDLLFLHAGDFLFPSLLSRMFEGEQMIDVMNLLDGDPEAFDRRMVVTFGNHEFDHDDAEDAGMLDRRVEESQFTWLSTNIDFLAGDDGRPLVEADSLLDSTIVELGGVRVGLFSLSTGEKHPEYVHCFGQPKAVARRMTAQLRRRGAEVVVALTHLRISDDVDLLSSLGADGPDLLIGGHEHNRQFKEVAGRLVIKADADARTATVARVTVAGDGPPTVHFEFRELGPNSPVDPVVQARIERWTTDHERLFCQQKGLGEKCLETPLGRTRVRLIGEELEIRRFETNLGNWIADQALGHFAALQVQAAFVNSGSLRLNQDIPADTSVTLRHVEEIFQYPSELRLLRLTGAVLQQAVAHSVTDWTGNGKWLQIAGFAFRHDPRTAAADRLTLLTPDGPRPVDPAEEILVVTNDFLSTPATGQDGYTMLSEDQGVPYDGDPVTLRDLVVAGLEAAEGGIAPADEGRICNTERPGACLAVER